MALQVGLQSDGWVPTYPVHGTLQPRCHPGATLVRNSATLQRLAASLGFGCAVNLSQDPKVAGFFDTLGLASQVMAVHGFRYEVSTAMVHHFFNVSYNPAKAAPSAVGCRDRLKRFRQ